MRILVVYDSFFGNTEKVAQAIGSAFGSDDEVRLHQVSGFNLEELKDVELLIFGSPTRGFRPSKPTQALLQEIPADGLKGVRAAAFDTRIPVKEMNNWLLTILVKIFGYAAEPIAKELAKKGAILAAPAEGFIVNDTEGPMREGELERAAVWARSLKTE